MQRTERRGERNRATGLSLRRDGGSSLGNGLEYDYGHPTIVALER